jgi:hypothetical protein
MYPEDRELAERCADAARGADRAGEWIRRNRALVGREDAGLLRDLGRAARQLRRLETAARRKMCVGVFGPSQSGKSYLISALARGPDGRLIADFGASRPDFVSEINPEGGKESTGLVTRFTLTRPTGATPEFPVRLRLLSEIDLVMILGNTYYEDFVHKAPPDPAEIAAALETLQGRRRGAVAGAPDADAMIDLRDYFMRDFSDKPRVQLLERTYWHVAQELAPQLEPGDRARLFGLIWGGAQPLTVLFSRLQQALERLGHAAEAFCPLAALIPRARSIIDVATLKGLADGGGPDQIELLTPAGTRASLPRALVTALTAEITIAMAQKPDDFFDHTDLLDFPGYHSRPQITEIEQELAREESLETLFLRGKVAYLFERFSAERELTAMLLCIAGGNQEVQSLPSVIDQWVRATHGDTPQRRAGRPVSLFFVLTKFDREFEEKKGALQSEETRWTVRLQASLTGFFGLNHTWPMDWDGAASQGGGAFRNLFWMRNPNVKAKEIFEYDDAGTELAIRADQRGYISALRQGFLANPDVARHFTDPARAWDAAMRLNDGGVAYLREQLRPVCRPELKRGQIAGSLTDWLQRLHARLRPFHRSDDREAERQEKRRQAVKLAGHLAKCVEAQRFGELLRAFQVADHELYDLFLTDGAEIAPGTSVAASAGEAGTIGAGVAASDILGNLFGDDAADAALATTPGAKPGNGPRDEAALRSRTLEQFWIGRMRSAADDLDLQRFFAVPGEALGQIVHELAQGAGRLGVGLGLERALREASQFRNLPIDKLVWKQASRAAAVLDAYVDYLGHDPRMTRPAERRVTLRGRDRLVFQPIPSVGAFPEIGETQSAYDAQYCQDWIAAFVDLMERNVDFDGDASFNAVENARLGEILKSIAA